MAATDLKELREQFDSDLDEWAEARKERAKDMRYRAGDPWEQEDKDARDKSGRPWITVDELSQYTNQIVNDMRVNPLSVSFAPGPPIWAGKEQIEASEEAASLYSDKWREIEYRSYAHDAYATAFENCVDGSYGYCRLVKEFAPGTFEQELRIKGVADPNTILPDPAFQRPDLSDMKRCFVLEKRKIKEFKKDFPKAKIRDFESFLNDDQYSRWIKDEDILLAEHWCVYQDRRKLLLVQPPSVTPPKGSYDMRGPVAPPPIAIPMDQWAQMPKGSTVLEEREDSVPRVVQQLVNGVEILSETTWPGAYIPIAGCMGRILYLDDLGTSRRIILSAIRLARDPFMSYCFYRTCEMEAVGQITKNPYWAYEGQVSPEQQIEIQKSLHEPVAVLFAKPVTDATGQQVLPLPVRNPQSADLQGFSIGAEEMRRACQAAMGGSFLPTTAQKNNEKSKVALEYIGQSAARGTFHFFDHYKAMRRHMAVLAEAAMDATYDTKRQITVRRQNEKTERVWVNDPGNQEAIDLRGSFTVEISDGQNVDSTREAASNFADRLLEAVPLMQMLGPQKAQKIAALAVKLKVKQTGIGSIGDEIVDIIDPQDKQELDPEQLKAQLQEADQLLQMAQQKIAELEQDAAAGITKEKLGALRDELKGEIQEALQQLKGQQAKEQIALKAQLEQRKQDDEQAHEASMAAADAEQAEKDADKQLLAGMAQPEGESGETPKGNASSGA